MSTLGPYSAKPYDNRSPLGQAKARYVHATEKASSNTQFYIYFTLSSSIPKLQVFLCKWALDTFYTYFPSILKISHFAYTS